MVAVTADLPAYNAAYYRTHRAEIRERQAARRRARGIPSRREWLAAKAAERQRFCRTCGNRLVDRVLRFCRQPCMPPSAKKRGLLATTRELICARPGCDEAFTTRKPNRIYHSKACRLAVDHSGRGRLRRFPRVRYVARRAIFERDGWICRPCGAPIDPELTFPHPGSASIDHRDPDGPHDPSNWQAAHLACNVAKGRKHHLGAVA